MEKVYVLLEKNRKTGEQEVVRVVSLKEIAENFVNDPTTTASRDYLEFELDGIRKEQPNEIR